MFCRLSSVILLLVIVVLPFNASATDRLTPQQQKNLVSNLNYLQYSIAKIKASDSKAIAEEEYYSVINKLKIENINDSDLNFAYDRFLDNCSSLKLKQNEKDFIKQMNIKAQKTAYLNAFSNFGSVFVPGQSPQQLVASLVYTSVANAFAVANTKNQLKTQLDRDMFYLNQDIMKTIYSLQSTLFTTSAKLLGGNSSKGRLNEDSMNMFVKALKLETNSERLNALSEPELKKNFESFPPLWYELGNAFQSKGDNKNALECYRRFELLKGTDIVAKDKNYINLLKNKIQILLGDDASKINSKALANKPEILKCISLLKANYLDSEAGEKNAYLAKIYYLIGESNESLKCLNYLIDSKTLYPEYIEEAISLRQLIFSASGRDKSPYYQHSYNYGKIVFGNENINFSEFSEKEKDGWLKQYWQFMKGDGIYGSAIKRIINYVYPKEENFIDEDHLSFIMPKSVLGDSNLSVSIGDKLYVPVLIDNPKSAKEKICIIDYDLDEIDKETVLAFHFDSKKRKDDVVVKYKIRPFKKKYYDAAQKAYFRIGSDIIAHNAEKVEEFGETMYKYKYQVDDVNKLDDEIRKEQEKEGKKNNRTKAEIGSEITKQLSEKLAPDLNFVQDRYKAVEESYYKRKVGVLYSPSLVLYGEDYYIVGIYSIYDSKRGKEAIFNSNGEMLYKKYTEYSTKINDSDQTYKMAVLGDCPSMVLVAESYLEGYGTKKNDAEAVRWLLKAASVTEPKPNDKQSVAKACKLLGECYREGRGVKKNSDVSIFWYRKAKDYGFNIEDKYVK